MKKITFYLVEAILALGIVIFTYCNYDLYDKSKLSNRPYDPEVWGTFSDWCLVLVTTLTAIYLIKTFQAQQKIRLLELMPHFELNLDGDNYMLSLHNATAFNIKAINIVKEVEFHPIPIWQKNHHPVAAHNDPKSNIGKELREYSKIEFEDVNQNKYSQTIYHTESILVIFPPKKR